MLFFFIFPMDKWISVSGPGSNPQKVKKLGQMIREWSKRTKIFHQSCLSCGSSWRAVKNMSDQSSTSAAMDGKG